MRTVIYTILFNNYDWLNDVRHINKFYDTICYTNNNNLLRRDNYKGWEIRKINEKNLKGENIENPKLITRWYKFNPSKHLDYYDNSVYVDASLIIKIDIKYFIEKCITKRFCLGIFEHPSRSTIRKEICHAFWNKKINYNEFRILKRLYKNKNINGKLNNLSLFENGLRYTNHSSKNALKILERTYDMFKLFPYRDQIIFPIVLDNEKLKLNLGIFNSSKDFIKINAHKTKGFKNIRRYILLKSNNEFFKYLLFPINLFLKIFELLYDFIRYISLK